MRILIAPDKFKGCLTALEVAQAIHQGIRDFLDAKPPRKEDSAGHPTENSHEIRIQPIGDGGEGTMELICSTRPGCRTKRAPVLNARGMSISAPYSVCGESPRKEAFIEMSSASGLAQIEPDQRNPEHSTSYGTGQMILHALENGALEIYIGLGGSATIDGGAGMLQALGMEFRSSGKRIDLQQCISGPLGLAELLLTMDEVHYSDEFKDLLRQVELHIVADVESPLNGEDGAIESFAGQKGLPRKKFPLYRKALEHFSRLCERSLSSELQANRYPALLWSEAPLSSARGAGAAGGMGFALLLLGAQMHPGFDFFCKQVGMDGLLDGVDLIITGEGKLDPTSLSGKGPGGVARLGHSRNIPCIAVCGKAEGRSLLEESSLFADIREIGSGLSLEESMERAAELIRQEVRGALNEGRYQ
ncbi:MAG: glycerate kinase, partial [Leptospiraceae bacterium]|nr:glycerate kinase [Leptospiraceae bacterium]